MSGRRPRRTVARMELENLFGLPAHPLLVHLPVVMIPLAAIGAILIAVRQSWLDRFGWWVVGFSFVGFIGAVLAAGSGEGLEERVDETAALEEHAEMGETARLVSLIFFLVVLAVVGYRWYTRRQAAAAAATPTETDAVDAPASASSHTPRIVAIVSSVLLIASAVGATATIVSAGHQGAKATWNELEDEGGDGDVPREEHDEDDDED